MKILSIETSGKICGISILEDKNVIKEITLNSGLTHSETLMPIIKQAFDEFDMKINDIDLIVCDKGPGSFTGIRIGIATAKAFSDSLDIRTIGVSSLEAICYNVNEKGVICSLIDARNNNCYWCIYENVNGKYLLRRNFDINNIDDILNELKNLNLEYNLIFTSDGTIPHKEKIIKIFPKSKFYEEDISPTKLALCGLVHLDCDKTNQDLSPMYLRKSQAEIVLEEKQDAKKD